MPILDANGENQVWRGLMRYWADDETRETVAIAKQDVLAAVQAQNAYLAGAVTTRPATSVNAAFPAPSQAGLTTPQKGLLTAMVALAQTGNIFALERVLGEVD